MSLVTIVIPNFNREYFIRETLESLLNQTYQTWEAIVVDDHSTDNSPEIIKEYSEKDKRIKLFARDRLPKGATTCRNIGVIKSKGDFLIFLDSDDILAPYCLEKRLEYFTMYPDQDVLVFPMLIFHKRPGDTTYLWSDYIGTDALSQFLRLQSPWQTTGPIWKRNTILKIGGWDEEVLTWQDWEFHIRALIKGVSYKIVNTLPDCFLRRDEYERISAGDMRLDRLYAKLKLFEKVIRILPKSEKQIENNKQSLAHLFFNHAERTAISWPNEKLAFYFHYKLREYKLVSIFLYVITSVYVSLLRYSKKMRLSLFTSIFYKIGHAILPKGLLKVSAKKSACQISELELTQINNLIRKHNV